MNPLPEARDLSDFVAPREKGPARSPRGWIIAHAVAWGCWLVVLTFGVRKIERAFADFGVDLPSVTVFAIKVAHMGVVLAPLLLILLGVDWSVLRALGRRTDGGRYRAWAIAMLVVPLLLFMGTIVALAVPFLSILTRLSG
jgi:hypothetical protein